MTLYVVKDQLHMKNSQAHVNANMIIHMRIIKFQIMTLFTIYIWESAYYSHLVEKYMTASFH
jgi:hypothetical protein